MSEIDRQGNPRGETGAATNDALDAASQAVIEGLRGGMEGGLASFPLVTDEQMREYQQHLQNDRLEKQKEAENLLPSAICLEDFFRFGPQNI